VAASWVVRLVTTGALGCAIVGVSVVGCLPSLPVELPPEIIFGTTADHTDFGPRATLSELVLVPGQSVALRAYIPDKYGTDGLQELVALQSSNPAIASVTAIDAHTLEVVGGGDGDATVDVNAVFRGFGDDGVSIVVEERHETLPVTVAPPTAVALEFGCGAATPLLLPAGQPFAIAYDAQSAGGHVSPFAPALVAVDAPALLSIAVEPRWPRAWVAEGAAPGPRTLRSAQDDVWEIALVVPADVDGAAFVPADARVAVGSATLITPQPLIDDVPVCQMQLSTTVHTTTPTVCRASAFPVPAHRGDICSLAGNGECDEPIACPPGTDTTDCVGQAVPQVGARLSVRVDGLQPGTCTLVFAWPEAAGGNGLTTSTTVAVDEAP
jgi:hypothetical protein